MRSQLSFGAALVLSLASNRDPIQSPNRRARFAVRFDRPENRFAGVPELTRNADIKLNTRVSLQKIQTGLA